MMPLILIPSEKKRKENLKEVVVNKEIDKNFLMRKYSIKH
jgi:hypothetical protein